MFSYHVCPNCARYFKGDSGNEVNEQRIDHICRKLRHPAGAKPTMGASIESEWISDHLRRAGGVPV